MSKHTLTQQIKASPKVVYDAWTTNVNAQGWLADYTTLDVREGGRFYAWWNTGYFASGIFSEAKENESLKFSWNGMGEPAETQVTVTLSEKDGGTLVTVEHDGIGDGEEWSQVSKDIEAGWQDCLTNLQFALEQGMDKRLYDRPFLGIMLNSALTKEQAESLGVSVDYGIRISGTVADTGAAEAGLQSDDVLTKMGETVLKGFNELTIAISAQKAGDIVPVELHRGKEVLNLDLRLSHRPRPEIPTTPAELAEEARKMYDEIDQELDEIFDGVSEEAASQRPEPKEWSAKETLAHLLFNEHSLQAFVTTQVSNQRAPGYGNDLGTIGAFAEVYTLAELRDELKRAEQIVVIALRDLPEDFSKNQFAYSNLAASVLQMNLHTRGHYPQIKAALEAAEKVAA